MSVSYDSTWYNEKDLGSYIVKYKMTENVLDLGVSQVALVVKNLPANVGNIIVVVSMPWIGESIPRQKTEIEYHPSGYCNCKQASLLVMSEGESRWGQRCGRILYKESIGSYGTVGDMIWLACYEEFEEGKGRAWEFVRT